MNTETFPDPRRAAEERRERYAEQQEQRSLEVAAEQERWLQSARQAAALERIADALEKLYEEVRTGVQTYEQNG
jgi:hypothetical protein